MAKMLKNQVFCEENSIMFPKQKRLEPNSIYSWRTRKYDAEVTRIRCEYEHLQKLIKSFTGEYDRIESQASQLGEPFMELPSFEVDFSNFDSAKQRMKELRNYLDGGHRILFDAQNKMMDRARKKFIADVIKNMPADKTVVVLLSNYTPRIQSQKGFWEMVDTLSSKKDRAVPGIMQCLWYEWIAFSPSAYGEEEIKNLNHWFGNPLTTEVVYK